MKLSIQNFKNLKALVKINNKNQFEILIKIKYKIISQNLTKKLIRLKIIKIMKKIIF